MKKRELQIYKAPGCNPDLPQIRLQGKWLSDYGFKVGERITVSIKFGKLIIEPSSKSSQNT